MSENLKNKHEAFWGELFADILKRYLDVNEVNVLPIDADPPDCLYEISYKEGEKARTWVEITGVYPSKNAARVAFEAARGKPPEEVGGFMVKPDRSIADLARCAILKKVRKATYTEPLEKYGLGHLLLVVPYQAYGLVNNDTVEAIQSRMPVERMNEQCLFRSVWVAYKQPEYDDGIVIKHLPTDSPSYAFSPLWPELENSVSW